ncbi:ORF7 [White spot syndrome virus]|uniref:Wsv425 n=3 Tax=White spot syndrome virus TaxID=342409 RepID=Q8VAI7_WSSVS|nr:wsv425 [Shrimp white spot syndrome virus]AFX59802.1 wsv425 [White spot syndrome virus]AAL33427.1 wsv425 [Shrimp white spot syndrome virus]AAL89352.1 WSSV484 [Shrimp white spot syndrome virus]ATU84008.1 ORF7 [White spot syndrome virus]AWQ60549.1 wsv425 [Shrimp white spot syndrome virus]
MLMVFIHPLPLFLHNLFQFKRGLVSKTDRFLLPNPTGHQDEGGCLVRLLDHKNLDAFSFASIQLCFMVS